MPFTLGFDVFVVVLVLLVIITIAWGVRTIPQGYSYTVERFGRYARTLGPGLGLIVPYIERVGHKVNVMEQVLDVPSQEAFTRDNAGVTIDAAAFYQVTEPARASYEVSDLQMALLTLTMTNIRTVVGSMDLDQLLSHRDEINERLLKVRDLVGCAGSIEHLIEGGRVDPHTGVVTRERLLARDVEHLLHDVHLVPDPLDIGDDQPKSGGQ